MEKAIVEVQEAIAHDQTKFCNTL